jgi:hypothetical protein
VVAEIVNSQDVGMVECRDRLRFLLKAPQPFRIAGKSRRQHLDRHLAVEPRIARPVHLTHAARTSQRHDHVRSKFGAGSKRHECPQL